MTRMMNLTAALGVGLLLGMGPGCAGDKGSDEGSDSAEGDGDSGGDSDSETDSDTEPVYFDDYVVSIAITMGFDGFGATDYTLPGDENAYLSFAKLTFIEEAYFDTGDEDSLCTYTGALSFEEPLDLGVEDVWYGNKVSLVGGTTTCKNFDPARFGLDTNPIEAVESLTFGIGYGPLVASDLETKLIENFDRDGLDFEVDGRPYYFTGYIAMPVEGGDTFETYALNYTVAYKTDEDMELLQEDGEYVLYDGMDAAVELPAPSLLVSPGYFGLYTENVFP